MLTFARKNETMLKLIADSGSTKTDWTLLGEEGGVLGTCHSQGLNPYHLSDEQITQVLTDEVIPSLLISGEKQRQLGDAPKPSIGIYFYGSGVTDAMIPKMERMLVASFSACGFLVGVEAHAASDMLGAARALLGHESGIAVILGTGSNSCYYDGENIVRGVPPLGYVLGDEGSGTAIGKAFFRLIYRNPKAASLREKFEAWSGKDYAAVIERIYRQPLANTYLASVSTFVGEHLSSLSAQEHLSQDEQIEKKLLSAMLYQVYGDFCREILSFYAQLADGAKEDSEMPSSVKVGFVGSIAHYFHDEIAKALHELGFQMGEVLKSPMEGLIRYHAGY